MSQPTAEQTDRPPVDHRRLFLILGLLVVVMLLLSVAAMTSLFGGDKKSTPVPVDTQPSASTAAAPLELAIAPQGAARCMAPSVQLLQNQDVAFTGTVTSIEGDQVTLSVDQWYLAPATSEAAAQPATVTLTAPPAELSKVLDSVEFVSDGQYLVSAREGAVSLCGLTARHTPELEALYATAYGV